MAPGTLTADATFLPVAESSTLQQASFRNVPFAVDIETTYVGRRKAVHEYFARDNAYIEDTGRALRRFTIEGFLISNSGIYGGGDAVTQRDQFVQAAETAGPGELVHPTLGSMQVDLLSCEITTRKEDGPGNYFALRLTCLQAGQLIFPTIVGSTGGAVTAAAANANSAAASDFSSDASDFLAEGKEVVSSAVQTTSQWAAKAGVLANDATSVTGIAASLQGNFGRFTGGRSVGGLSQLNASANANIGSITSAIGSATAARSGVGNAGATLNRTASDLGL